MKHIKPIIVSLICFVFSAAVFVMIVLILREDVPLPEWLPFDFHDGPWLAAILKLFGVLLIGPTFASLIVSIAEIGVQQKRWSLHQNWTDEEVQC